MHPTPTANSMKTRRKARKMLKSLGLEILEANESVDRILDMEKYNHCTEQSGLEAQVSNAPLCRNFDSGKRNDQAYQIGLEVLEFKVPECGNFDSGKRGDQAYQIGLENLEFNVPECGNFDSGKRSDQAYQIGLENLEFNVPECGNFDSGKRNDQVYQIGLEVLESNVPVDENFEEKHNDQLAPSGSEPETLSPDFDLEAAPITVQSSENFASTFTDWNHRRLNYGMKAYVEEQREYYMTMAYINRDLFRKEALLNSIEKRMPSCEELKVCSVLKDELFSNELQMKRLPLEKTDFYVNGGKDSGVKHPECNMAVTLKINEVGSVINEPGKDAQLCLQSSRSVTGVTGNPQCLPQPPTMFDQIRTSFYTFCFCCCPFYYGRLDFRHDSS